MRSPRVNDGPAPGVKGEERLPRVIGTLGYAALTLNGVIGAGIFALPAVAAAAVGGLSPWLFVVCAVIILTVVLSFASAASFARHTGGPIVYATAAFGPFAGFQTGWMLWLSRVAAMAANTLLLVTYSAWFFPQLDAGWPRAAAVILAMGGLAAVNIAGVRQGMLAIYAMSVLKLLPLLALVGLGLFALRPEAAVPGDWPGAATLGETILVLLYAYVGFENAVIPAGEGRNPRRDIPRALIRTVLSITILYALLQWVAISLVPDLGTTERPLAAAADVLWGPVGGALLALTAVFSIFGNCLASVMGAPRLTYALATDGRLPAWFARIHPTFRTPHASIGFYAAVALLLALTDSFLWLAAMSTLVRLGVYVIVIVSLPRLQSASDGARAFRLPGGYLIPLLALALCAWLATHADARAWATAAVFFLIGSGLYGIARRRAASA